VLRGRFLKIKSREERKMEISLQDLKGILCSENSCAEVTQEGSYNNGLHIVILQRGWVVVGEIQSIGCMVNISKAHVIRRCGTTDGLAQLANLGPQSETKLDQSSDMQVHQLAIVATLKCQESSWN
jgi:hypothetical protein